MEEDEKVNEFSGLNQIVSEELVEINQEEPIDEEIVESDEENNVLLQTSEKEVSELLQKLDQRTVRFSFWFSKLTIFQSDFFSKIVFNVNQRWVNSRRTSDSIHKIDLLFSDSRHFAAEELGKRDLKNFPAALVSSKLCDLSWNPN